MMRKQAKEKPKEEPEEKVRVRGILVLFTLEGLKPILRDVTNSIACYGRDTILADTRAMDKILKAMAEGESEVII